MFKTLVESMVGRKLNEEEESIVNWIDGLDTSKENMILNLLKAAFDHGREFERVWPNGSENNKES